MAEEDQDKSQQPIIIVKRHGGHHDEHHGGVWKIAFADFMTAMMAFFLVMWLINAANEETRSQVASYFNPVKLTDAVAGPKGVRSNEPYTETEEHNDKNAEGGGGARQAGGGGSDADETESSEEEKKVDAAAERALFQDPYAVLVEIAGERSPGAVANADSQAEGQGGGLAGGEAFRDPFDPALWLTPDDGKKLEENIGLAAVDDDPTMKMLNGNLPVDGESKSEDPVVEKTVKTKSNGTKPPPTEMPGQTVEKKSEKMQQQAAMDQAAVQPEDQAGEDEPSDPAERKPVEKMQQDLSKSQMAAAKLKAEIKAATETAGTDKQPVLSVEKTDEGLVVSLTDDLDFGMFASASARPNAEMVQFMDRIAGVLAKRKGRLVVRGHTDSRPFRSDAYDNWRLSTARAHMAYHMLVRGGVDTDRFARIEGYADRDPRNKSNTKAAENRRIEILLVENKS